MNDAELTAAEEIRVFLVDDHAMVRAGLIGYLEMVEDIIVVGEADNGQGALDRIAVLEPSDALPDVVLMDLLMPKMDGIEATRQLKARWPDIEVVVVTSFLEEAKVRAALEAGAAGYLLKDAEADEVARATAPQPLANATSIPPSQSCWPRRFALHAPPSTP